MNKKIALLLVFVLLINNNFSYFRNEQNDDEMSFSVDVKGAVTNPGVYTYDEPILVNDILNDLNLTENADTSCVNLANEVSTNTVLTVPTLLECSNSNLININTASAMQISLLDGIGETRAQDIVDYRLENGSFSSIDELMDVPGIGETTYEKIKGQITI